MATPLPQHGIVGKHCLRQRLRRQPDRSQRSKLNPSSLRTRHQFIDVHEIETSGNSPRQLHSPSSHLHTSRRGKKGLSAACNSHHRRRKHTVTSPNVFGLNSMAFYPPHTHSSMFFILKSIPMVVMKVCEKESFA